MNKAERITKLETEVKYLNKQVERLIDDQIYILKLFIKLYTDDDETQEHEE